MSNKANHSYSSNQGAPADLPMDQPPPPSSSGMRRANNSAGIHTSKLSSGNSVGSHQIRSAPSNVSQGTSASQQHQHQTLSVERSPLPPMILKSLGDRSNEKRKNAALEIEGLVKSLQEANSLLMIQNVIEILSKD